MVAPTKQMMANAHKVAFFVDQYPTHTLRQIISLFKEMPPIDTNVAIWTAVDQGLIETDLEKDVVTIKNKPAHWDFGDIVRELETKLEYAFHKVAEKEGDLEEVYLGNWTLGYAASDVMVAMRHLIDRGVVTSYDVEDTDKDGSVNPYLFYTLVENEEKHWGLKQFKKAPVPGVVERKEAEQPADLPDAAETTTDNATEEN